MAELVARHPALFHSIPPDGSHLPLGWLSLADALCVDLEAILGDRTSDLKIWTIKSKFAALRVYVKFALPQPHGAPLDPVVRAHAGDYSITSHRQHPLLNAVEDLIAGATERSTRLCQWCGAPSQLLLDGGWVNTACPSHTRPGSITLLEYERRVKAKASKKQVDDDDE